MTADAQFSISVKNGRTLRVISGTKRGHLLRAPRGDFTRPTSDRTREAIFNILGRAVEGARVLDLFAGTGALGIEALSRGAESALFVDLDERAARMIRENLKRLGFETCSEVWRTAYDRALRKLRTQGDTFDLIFSDPPYRSERTDPVLCGLVENGVVAEGGIVVVECWKKERVSEALPQLSLLTERTYGETRVSVWRALA